jgi:hypothetical protein
VNIELTEALHWAEIKIIERIVSSKKEKNSRKEKCHWQIRNNRVNLLNRRIMKGLYKPISRDLKFASTISYEVRQQERDADRIRTHLEEKFATTTGVGRGQQLPVRGYVLTFQNTCIIYMYAFIHL